ncbi:unnamed protein product [Rhizophagus irregularis]|nr:unnamed protein product [Rhizophagus irregularis]
MITSSEYPLELGLIFYMHMEHNYLLISKKAWEPTKQLLSLIKLYFFYHDLYCIQANKKKRKIRNISSLNP